MEHFPFATLPSLWAWDPHALGIPREMQPDWGTDPPLTLDKEEASMLGFRVSVTPSPPRKTSQEKAEEVTGAMERCERRVKEEAPPSDTSSPDFMLLPHPPSSPSFSNIYRRQDFQEDVNAGGPLRGHPDSVNNGPFCTPLRHRGDRSISRGISAIAALAEYGSSPPLTPAGKRPTSSREHGVQRGTFGERFTRLPLGSQPVNIPRDDLGPGPSSMAPKLTRAPPAGKKKRKKAPRKARKRSQGVPFTATNTVRSTLPRVSHAKAESKPTPPRSVEKPSSAPSDDQNRATHPKRPQLAASQRVSDDAAGLDLLALAAATTLTDPPEIPHFLTFDEDEDEPQDDLIVGETWREEPDGFPSIARPASGGFIADQYSQPPLMVEVEDLIHDDAAVLDSMRTLFQKLDPLSDDGVMGDLLESVSAGLDGARMLEGEGLYTMQTAAGGLEPMLSQMHDATTQWSLSQPPSAIFGTEKILPLQTTSIPSSDTFEPTSELDLDSAASTPLNLRRIFTGQAPNRSVGSRSSETNEAHHPAPDSPTPVGKRSAGCKRPMSSEILGNEEDSIFISDKADVSLSGSAGVKRWKHGRPFQRETGKPNATDEFALSIAERAKRTRSQAANPTTPVGHQPTSRPRLTAKASTGPGPAKTPSSALKKTLSGSSSGTCFEPATPERESSPDSDFEASFKPSKRSFKTPKYPRKSYTPVELDIIAKYWQGGTDPIRLETLDKICAELKQKGFKRTRDALKTHMGTNLRTLFAQRFRKNFTHTTRGIPVQSCSFET